ncbi:MAG: ankyrin repeat domain-containing protein [Sulfuricurvum sp.]|nr:ankyrin repeat domain-containing protein [Sulfuricurvum sp.]
MRGLLVLCLSYMIAYGGMLHDAVYDGNIEKIQNYLQNHNVDEQNEAGLTALHVAIKLGDLKIFQLLLDKGADINAQDFNGNTPLILAVKKKNIELVTFVILHGADVNLANNDGITPLHQAAFSGNEDVTDFLLKAKANPYLKNNDGATPYDFAIAKKNLVVAQIIKLYM